MPAAALYRSVLPKETFNRVFNEGVVARVVLYARWWSVPIDALIACVGPERDIESFLKSSMPHSSSSGLPPYKSNPMVDEKTRFMKEGQLARIYSTEGVGNNVDRIENHFQKEDPCDYLPSEIPGVLMIDGKFTAPIRTRKWFNSVMYVLHRRNFDCRAFVEKMTEYFGKTAMDEALQYRKNRWFVDESAKRFGPEIVPIK